MKYFNREGTNKLNLWLSQSVVLAGVAGGAELSQRGASRAGPECPYGLRGPAQAPEVALARHDPSPPAHPIQKALKAGKFMVDSQIG